jgi:hypothetical protein
MRTSIDRGGGTKACCAIASRNAESINAVLTDRFGVYVYPAADHIR